MQVFLFSNLEDWARLYTSLNMLERVNCLKFKLIYHVYLFFRYIHYIYIRISIYVAFSTIMAISRQNEARSREYALLLLRVASKVLYSSQYHRQNCILQAFEQFGELYMHNHGDKYPARPGFEPGTSRLQAPVDTNEPSGPAHYIYKMIFK